MKARVWMTGAEKVATALKIAPEQYRIAIKRRLIKIGADATRTIKQEYRIGGTTKTRTAVRSGKLLNSYGYQASVKPGVSELDVGVLKAENAKVLLYARVQEGFDANGNRVSQFDIRPHKQGGYLKFVGHNQKGGLAKKNETGEVFVKRVILRPRPALIHVKKPILEKLRRSTINAAKEASKLASTGDV